VKISEEVREALAANRPVVALESTIIAHGLPKPANLEAAIRWENQIRAAGATPATVAIIDGVPTVGLSQAELERIALGGAAQAHHGHSALHLQGHAVGGCTFQDRVRGLCHR
jgi:pseudouridine-5'-phosphate glycosidase